MNLTPFTDQYGYITPEAESRNVVTYRRADAAASVVAVGVAAGLGSSNITTTGTATVSNGDGGQILVLTTAASSGVFASVQQTANPSMILTQGVSWFSTAEMPTTITSIRRFVGLRNDVTNNTQTNDTVASWSTPCAFLGFRYSTNASDPGWMAVVADGGGLQWTYATGVPVVASTRYLFGIDIRSRKWADMYIGVGLPNTFGYDCRLVQRFDLNVAFAAYGTSLADVSGIAWFDAQQNLAASARELRWSHARRAID